MVPQRVQKLLSRIHASVADSRIHNATADVQLHECRREYDTFYCRLSAPHIVQYWLLLMQQPKSLFYEKSGIFHGLYQTIFV